MQNTLAVISLKRILKNAQLVKERAGVPLYAVVKDDAYGHGAEQVALALEGAVKGFCVATVQEGAALRTSGVVKEILVLTPCLNEAEALSCAAYGLTPSLSSPASMKLALRAAERFAFPLTVQLAVNTGMNRYGFRPDFVRTACRTLLPNGVTVTGVYSHLYAPQIGAAREEQAALFQKAAEEVLSFYPTAIRHLSATGGILAGGNRCDAVRAGIALYGYLPDGFEGTLAVRPALKIYAYVAGSAAFTGGGAGYAPAEKNYKYLHTLRVGYGDGVFRKDSLGAVGNLCMDATVREGRAKFGARKLLFESVTEYARAHGTTEYEALVNLTKKSERVYV